MMPHQDTPHDEPATPAGDPELAAMLRHISGAEKGFRHRQHVNLAYLAVRRYGMPDAADRVCGWIRRLAEYERLPQKYHHTISRAWVELVAHHVRADHASADHASADPDAGDFDGFARRHPALLDKRLPHRHYRSTTLAAPAARTGWVEPDLLPLPGTAASDRPGKPARGGGGTVSR